MATAYRYDPALARLLILDELFDLSLYKVLRDISADAEARSTLDQLVVIEIRHLAFWQKFFDMQLDRLNPVRRLKLWSFTWLCRLFGSTAIHLVLEAIEHIHAELGTSTVLITHNAVIADMAESTGEARRKAKVRDRREYCPGAPWQRPERWRAV